MLYRAPLAVGCVLLASPIAAAPVVGSQDQVPLQEGAREELDGISQHGPHSTTSKRPLTGRFLHMTDFHPDLFYKTYSSTSEDSACHRGHGPAGIYGAETSQCDSPFSLVNQTLSWIGRELKDSIDFVVWTGDSARHDNDEKNPRNVQQVTELNEYMVDRVHDIFGNKHDDDDENPNNDFIIPVVPNLGNNDVLPHNIIVKGPNKWTRTYAKLWRPFIPEPQKHSFEQGGWFYVEVIPNKLAVFSLNTLYFFDSNSGVDGCALRSEPGYQQMEWLRIQLEFLRQRGMKAILSGHVPPARTKAKKQWDETCWQKYALWLRQYRDVVITGLFGHMNYDHFFLQDFHKIREGLDEGQMGMEEWGDGEVDDEEEEDDEVHTLLSSNYFTDLRDQWSKIPKPPKGFRKRYSGAEGALQEISDEERPDWEIEQLVSTLKKDKDKKKKKKDKKKDMDKYLSKIGGEFAERYASSFVSPSVVPNLFPTLRVYEYNITGLYEDDLPTKAESRDNIEVPESEEGKDDNPFDSLSTSKKHKKKEKKKRSRKSRKTKFTVPSPPSSSSPPGPAYSPQPLSLLKYTQYYANLTVINNDFDNSSPPSNTTLIDDKKWSPGHHHGKKPHPRPHGKPNPRPFEFEVFYDSRDDDIYRLEDLTMPRLVELARRIGGFREPEPETEAEDEALSEAEEEPGVDNSDSETETDDDADEDDDEDDDEDEDLAVSKKKHRKHKKHHRKHHHRRRSKGKGNKHDYSKRNMPWYTFIERAFVGTLAPGEVREEFGW